MDFSSATSTILPFVLEHLFSAVGSIANQKADYTLHNELVTMGEAGEDYL